MNLYKVYRGLKTVIGSVIDAEQKDKTERRSFCLHSLPRVLVMTKSELIEYLAEKQTQLQVKDVELSVKLLLDYMSDILASGDRIEIRGFGSFSLHYRAPRTGRNPKTGESVVLEGKYVPHFKPGKEMRDRVNESISN